jgi:tryptophan 2,3-dioxygenase
MRLVLDTNIFISAFYWGGNSQKVVERIIAGLDKLIGNYETMKIITPREYLDI